MTIRRSRALLSVGVASAVVVVGFAFIIRRVEDQWDDVRELLEGARPAWVVVALLLAIVSVSGFGLRWARCLEMMGVSPRRWSVLRWFSTGQLGKYVPGGIWHVVGQGELARRAGVARSVAYASVLLATIGLYGTAAVVVVLLTILTGGEGPSAWFLVGALVIAILAFEPRFLARVFRRTPEVRVPDRPATLRFAAGNSWVWLLVATATVAVAKSISPDVSVRIVATAAVGSWLVGFLTLPAPGGLGVREAAFVVLAEASLGSVTAAAVALLARMVFVVADASLPALMWAGGALQRRVEAARRPPGAGERNAIHSDG